MVQQMIAFVLGLYLLAESIAAAAEMDGGDRICRMAKYMVTGAAGLWMILRAEHVDYWHLTMASALALFLWPRLVERAYELLSHCRRAKPERRRTRAL